MTHCARQRQGRLAANGGARYIRLRLSNFNFRPLAFSPTFFFGIPFPPFLFPPANAMQCPHGTKVLEKREKTLGWVGGCTSEQFFSPFVPTLMGERKISPSLFFSRPCCADWAGKRRGGRRKKRKREGFFRVMVVRHAKEGRDKTNGPCGGALV